MDKYAIYTYEPRRVAMEADWTQENQNSGIDIKDAQSILERLFGETRAEFRVPWNAGTGTCFTC